MTHKKIMMVTVMMALATSSMWHVDVEKEVQAEVVQTAAIARTSGWNHSGVGIGVGVGSGYHRYGYEPSIMYGRNLAPDALIQVKKINATSEIFHDQGSLALIKSKGLWGILGTDGQERVAPIYKYITIEGSNGLLKATTKEKGDIILLSPDGKVADSAALDRERNQDKDQLISFRDPQTKLYGFQTLEGTTVLPAIYKDVMTEFSDDRAFVKNGEGKKVAIDSKGREVFVNPYKDVQAYDNGLAEYYRTVSTFSFGSFIGAVFGGGGYWNGIYQGLDVVKYDGIKRGYINTEGVIVIDSKLDRVYPMTPLGTIVENEGKLAFLNREGQVVIPYGDYSPMNMDINFGYLGLKDKNTGKFGVMSMIDGKTVLPFSYEGLSVLTQGMVAAKTATELQIISMPDANRVLFAVSKDAKLQGFGTDAYMWVTKDTLLSADKGYKIVDTSGTILYTDTKGVIQDVTTFAYGYSNVKINGKWGIMDAQGNMLVQPIYESIVRL